MTAPGPLTLADPAVSCTGQRLAHGQPLARTVRAANAVLDGVRNGRGSARSCCEDPLPRHREVMGALTFYRPRTRSEALQEPITDLVGSQKRSHPMAGEARAWLKDGPGGKLSLAEAGPGAPEHAPGLRRDRTSSGRPRQILQELGLGKAVTVE